MKRFLFLSSLTALFLSSGCFHPDNDEELRTVPVTNNPYVVPNHGNGIPGSGAASPY